MKVIETKLKECFIIEPSIIKDDRGYFFESFNKNIFENLIGKKIDFVQDNQSKSSHGVIRGLHFQKGEHAQAKLVKVLSGKILDVAVDLRVESETFGKYESVVLSSENKRQLYAPRGFAHGFSVLSTNAEVLYKCDNYYDKASEGGISYNDPTLAIDWKIKLEAAVISDKDKLLPSLQDFRLSGN